MPLSPRSAADAKPKALTVGTQGATSSPVLSKDGKRVAWLEMREGASLHLDSRRSIADCRISLRRWLRGGQEPLDDLRARYWKEVGSYGEVGSLAFDRRVVPLRGEGVPPRRSPSSVPLPPIRH